MPIRRQFLDWTRPALAAAAGFLWEQYGRGQRWDLERVIMALPGGRAGRLLLERLVHAADEHGALLTPPRIVTVGGLPELLYEVKKPLADDLTQELAWVQALQGVPERELARLVRQRPADGDLAGWLALGKMLSRVHTELAADRLDFSAVERKGREIDDFREAERWQTLDRLQQRYLAILDGQGLWDRQTARLFAIDHRECRTERDIVLVGTVDIDRSGRAMLDQVADRVTALIVAPAERKADFDEHGCLVVERWRENLLPIERDQISVVDGPADQADAVIRALSRWQDDLAADEVTIGAADESVVPYLEQRLEEAGLKIRFGAGRSLARSRVVQFLELVADYLELEQFSQLAALARHPDVHAWLVAGGVAANYLEALDRFFRDHLPSRFDDDTPAHPNSDSASDVCRRIKQLLSPLAGKPRPLRTWDEPIVAVLTTIYGSWQLDRANEADRAVLEVCREVSGCLEILASLPKSLAASASGEAALRLLVERIARHRLPPPSEAGAVEVLGWLELPLDDARAAIVTGMNEGIVPGTSNADLFLPDRLRGALGLEDNDRRYARDNYALHLLAASRRLKLIAGRRGPEGDPLIPSRLLFATAADEMAQRALRFFSSSKELDEATSRLHLAGGLRAGKTKTDFPIPKPAPLRPQQQVTSLRVTELRDYLACPYRYYLRHRLKLDSLADAAEELAATDFGSLMHDVLKSFADDPRLADATDPLVIQTGLDQILDRLLDEQFGSGVLAAVRLQAEQIRGRLHAFARWQAKWRKAGWRIHLTEFSVKDSAGIFIPGSEDTRISLHGRIDRIDVHEADGRTIVFDYKTGDNADTPEKTHRKKEEWTDLQLPMYRHLLRAIPIAGPVELGYIVLPKDTSKVEHHLADWGDATLADADATALRVLRAIRDQVFWPKQDDTNRTRLFPELAAICQEDLLLVTGSDDAENGAEGDG